MRHEEWPRLLAEEIEAARCTPFKWGVHDCALFACRVVAAMTGVDHGEPFRGRYSSERGAAKVIKAAGGLKQIATDALGVEIPPAMAGRGDVVIIIENDHEALGVCIGDCCAFAGHEGLTFHPMSRAVTAWRVV